MSNKLTVNSKHKDTVFRMLFNSKKELLSLYNAVNGTNYDNVDDLEINTLEEGVFIKMKNDISFVFGFEMSLYEHQSTKCGNICLRFLFYESDLLAGIVAKEDIYKSSVIKIPVPRFVVFYNGTGMTEDIETVRLSDQFEKKVATPELELTATIININENHNPKIMEACKSLRDYSIFVGRIRRYAAVPDTTIEDAVVKSIDECISEGILEDFLRKNRAEVKHMSIFEYNEELHEKSIREEAAEEYNKIIAEKDAEIAEKDTALAEKDARIAELEALLAAKK
ncbi:hypothetical protein [Butyrivibrio sp. AE3004]|uniref:hypothetical protein n=1 Tax=Butyrivibrio sp. AE3004 TaxID=1506994 RepID=UPI00068D8F6C|nr:hypothetical protein [Butyrivibrio sp. AE3004]